MNNKLNAWYTNYNYYDDGNETMHLATTTRDNNTNSL